MNALVTSVFNSLLMVILPLADAMINGRSPASLLTMYVAESVVLLILNPLRILIHRLLTDANGHYVPAHKAFEPIDIVRKARTSNPNQYLSSILLMCGIFTVVHALFVGLLVFLAKMSGPVIPHEIRLALYWAAISQLSLFAADLLSIRGWPFPRLAHSAAGSVRRLLATQFGLIFGTIAYVLTESPWAILGTLLFVRIALDLTIDLSQLTHWRESPEGRKERREAEAWLSEGRTA